jgi:anti-anti-sigma factor
MTSDPAGRVPLQPQPPDPLTAEPTEPLEPTEPGAPILDQAFDAESLYALRAAVAAHATQAGLPPGRADDLVIAVHELAANAVRHGAGHGRLQVWKTDQALRCQISDYGAPPPPATDARSDQQSDGYQQDATQWRTEPGHGLFLVRQVADRATLRSSPDGTLVTITFALPAPGPAFALDQHQTNGCTVLTVTGPLHLGSAARLTQAINALTVAPKTPQKLVLDLTGLTGWDSSGLAALLTAKQRVPAQIVLAGLPAHLAEHLHETGLAAQFTLADTVAAATGN